tara:strand:- start:14571 stop:14852 length:282 start_codon:yes stop_codon:yes gene_type:complete
VVFFFFEVRRFVFFPRFFFAALFLLVRRPPLGELTAAPDSMAVPLGVRFRMVVDWFQAMGDWFQVVESFIIHKYNKKLKLFNRLFNLIYHHFI